MPKLHTEACAFIRLVATLFVVRLCVSPSDYYPSKIIASDDR